MRRTGFAAALLVLAMVAAACGGGSSVGKGIDVNKLKDKTGGTRLGETTSTQALVTTTAPPTTRPAVVITARAATVTTAAKPVSLEIKIQSASPQYNPADPDPVRVGSVVRWTNTDTVPRYVVSLTGFTYNSGPIAPGGHIDYTTTQACDCTYSGGDDRPYAQGTLHVR